MLCFSTRHEKVNKYNRSYSLFYYTWLMLCLSVLFTKFLFIICNVKFVLIIIKIDLKIIICIVVTIHFAIRNK